MGEIPEHLLKRAAERKAALAAQDGDSATAEESSSPANANANASSNTETSSNVSAAGDSSPAPAPVEAAPIVRTGAAAKVPEMLFQRSAARRAFLNGEAPAAGSAGGGVAVAEKIADPSDSGPDGHTHRLLTVVKSGSIQQVKGEAQDKVHTWPHLVSVELGSMLVTSATLFLFSMFVRAPLLGLADFNQTPNPSKAPWYFLGLQELLTMFHPMVAGVTIPGVALALLAITPYFDKNPSVDPDKRKFAITMMTIFLVFWGTLVIIGSFFRGQGFNFVFPMNSGVYFEL
jgi:menaquinol-cytochrome c reductase cytochrome b/c subunit